MIGFMVDVFSDSGGVRICVLVYLLIPPTLYVGSAYCFLYGVGKRV